MDDFKLLAYRGQLAPAIELLRKRRVAFLKPYMEECE